MPRINRRIPLRRPDALTGPQEWDLLTGGPSAFSTPEERKRAWFRHRDELIAALGPTVRPQAFWDYEHVKAPGEKCFTALKRLGLLTPEERHVSRHAGRKTATPSIHSTESV